MRPQRFERSVWMLFILLGSLAIMGCSISWFDSFRLSFVNLVKWEDLIFGPSRDVAPDAGEPAPAQGQPEPDSPQATSKPAEPDAQLTTPPVPEDQPLDTEELVGVYEGTISFPPYCKDCEGATMNVIENHILITVGADGSAHGEIEYSNQESWQSGSCSVDFFSRTIRGTLTGSLIEAEGQIQSQLAYTFRQEESGGVICTPQFEWTSKSDLPVSITITNGTMKGIENCLFDCFQFEAERRR